MFKKSTLTKARNLVRLARKVLHYRLDLLEDDQIKRIEDLVQCVERDLKEKKTSSFNTKSLKRELSFCGGAIYPVRFWNENVEIFLVAAILAIGIRCFFVQPFKIPTNSMAPTYHGMRSCVYSTQTGQKGPSVVEKAWRFLTFGSVHYEVSAPKSAEISFPLFAFSDRSSLRISSVRSRLIKGYKWFGIFPAERREYILYVGDAPVSVWVPADFNLEEVLLETYFPKAENFKSVLEEALKEGRIEQISEREFVLRTGVVRSKGDRILSFDILAGDTLFVDRLSYHFIPPKVGDPVVFRTRNVPGIPTEDKYYIKRLVGLAGDILQVRAPVLYRNGKPIEGAKAFLYNAQRKKGYAGYLPQWRLGPGKVDVVTEGCFYVMGDNSPQSSDSRRWGYVPQQEVVGRALFIFYPFTSHFGVAK